MDSRGDDRRHRETEPDAPPYRQRPEGGKPMPLDEPDAGYSDDLPDVGYAEDDPPYDPGRGRPGVDGAGTGPVA